MIAFYLFIGRFVMEKLYARLTYEIIRQEIFRHFDDGFGEVCYNDITDIVIEAFQKVGLLFFLEPMQVAKICTSGLEYTVEEFIDSLTRGIAEEDNDLLERIEAYE
jgi:hypothetical protein